MSIQFNFKLNRFKFNSIKLDSKLTEFNSTHFISISTLIQIQFNFKFHINFNSNAIQFQIMNTNSNSTSTKISSIRFQINFISMLNKFNFNAITFTSIQLEFQFKTFQFNLNSIWFNFRFKSIQVCFDSIQLASMKIDHLRPGRVPASRQAENYNSSKGFIIKKYWIFTSRQISIFQPFSRWQKKKHF